MKKMYQAPQSKNVCLDPLMVTFGTGAASPAGPSLTPSGTVTGTDINPSVLTD